MGKKAAKTPIPTAPDPTKTAAEQYRYNRQAAADQINMNSMDRYGPFGYSKFNRAPLEGATTQNVPGATLYGSSVPGTGRASGVDYAGATAGGNPAYHGLLPNGAAGPEAFGTPTSIEQGFDPRLQGGFDNVMERFGAQTAGIPEGFDFSGAGLTAQGIFDKTMQAYNAGMMPGRIQQQADLQRRMAERGLGYGSEISNNEYGNQWDAFNRQDLNAAATAANAMPGHLSSLTGTMIQQGMAPGQLAGQSIGLMGSGLGLLPNAQQASGSVGSPDFAGMTQNNFTNQMAAYKAEADRVAADNAGKAAIWKTLLGATGTALGGPLGGAVATGFGNMFNGAGGGMDANGS
jgi:hypothetical protein